MYKHIISYELPENVTQSHLLEVAQKVTEDWMKHQPGFIKWEIHTNKEDNCYTDLVYWESEATAKKSEAQMANMPHAEEWYACYQPGTISSKNLTRVAEF